MIKLIAAVLMVIDHIGVVFFPETVLFRAVGRLSMPLFAYTVSRGFEASRQHGTLKKYLKNLAVFAAISQIPFYLMAGGELNIGFTWLFSLLLLISLSKAKENRPRAVLECLAIGIISDISSTDYGLYGVCMPLALRQKYTYYQMFLYTVILWAVYVFINGAAGLLQVVSCLSVPLIALLKPLDKKVSVPKGFFYVFYPAHILILLAMQALIR